MRLILTDREKKEWLQTFLRIKRECVELYEDVEDSYKEAYEVAIILEKEYKVDASCKSIFTDIKSYICERICYFKIKQLVMENTEYKSNEIALTVKDLIRMKGKALVLIGPMVYDKSIPKSCLKNLEVICSDADFSKLDDSKAISNLQIILGYTIMPDLTSPIRLFFTGDIADLTKVSKFDMLPFYNFSAGDVLVSSITDDLKLEKVNGAIKVFNHDIPLELENPTLYENNVICYPNDNLYLKEQEKFSISYKVKRKKLR